MIDLRVVIAIIDILVALWLPASGRNGTRVHQAEGFGNQRQRHPRPCIHIADTDNAFPNNGKAS